MRHLHAGGEIAACRQAEAGSLPAQPKKSKPAKSAFDAWWEVVEEAHPRLRLGRALPVLRGAQVKPHFYDRLEVIVDEDCEVGDEHTGLLELTVSSKVGRPVRIAFTHLPADLA